MRKNIQAGRVKVDDRVFQIEFFDDIPSIRIPYVSVFEIITKEVKKNWFSRETKTKEVKALIFNGWTENNRLEFAMKKISEHLEWEQDRIKEKQEIEVFCKNDLK